MACGIILWASPLAPLFLIGGAWGLAAMIILLPRPQTACYLAALLSLWPYGLRPPPLDFLYTIGVNGAIGIAAAASLVRAVGQRQTAILGPTGVGLLLYIGWASVTALWAPDLVEARKALVGNVDGFLLFVIVCSEIRSVGALSGLMTVLRIIGWAMVACGAYAFAAGGFQLGSRLKIFDMNENEFGLVLIAMIPGVIWPVFQRTGVRRHISMALSIFFLICALALIALTGSRGSSLALLLVLIAFLFSRHMRPWGGVGLALLLAVLACMPFLLASVLTRFAQGDGGEFGARDLLWQAGLSMFGDAPWTGVGIGNAPGRLHNYIAALTNEFNRREDLPAHNPILEVALETGVLGVCLYVMALASAVHKIFGPRWHTQPCSSSMPGYFPLVLGTCLGYATAWLKGGGVEYHPTLFLMLALLVIPSQLTRPPSIVADTKDRGSSASSPQASIPHHA